MRQLVRDLFRFRPYLLPSPRPSRNGTHPTTIPSPLYPPWPPLPLWPFDPFAPVTPIRLSGALGWQLRYPTSAFKVAIAILITNREFCLMSGDALVPAYWLAPKLHKSSKSKSEHSAAVHQLSKLPSWYFCYWNDWGFVIHYNFFAIISTNPLYHLMAFFPHLDIT